MKKAHFSLSKRRKYLLGLTTLSVMRRETLLLRLLLMLLLLLPWIEVVLGFVASWQTYAIGDSMQIPLWAWAAAVILPAVAWFVAHLMANRIMLQYYLRRRYAK